MTGELDIIGPPSDPPLSEHVKNEIAAAFHGVSLKPGDPVPGCPCDKCGRFAFPRPTVCWWWR